MDILEDEKFSNAVESIRLNYTFHAGELVSKFNEYEKSLKDLHNVMHKSWKKFFRPIYYIVSYGVWSFSFGTFTMCFYHFITNTPRSTILTLLETSVLEILYIIFLVFQKKVDSLENLVLKNNILFQELVSIHREASYLDQTLYKLVPTVNFEAMWNNEMFFENNNEIFKSSNNINPVFKIWYIRMMLKKEFEERNNDIMVNYRKMIDIFCSDVAFALCQVIFSDLRIKLVLSLLGTVVHYKRFKFQKNEIIFKNINKISKVIQNNFLKVKKNL